MDVAPVFHPARSKYLVFTTDYVVPFLIIIGILSLLAVALYSPIFKIAEVNCALDYQECSDPSVIAELDKFKGRNIFTLKPSDVTTRLTSGDFTIREASLSKELPGTISLSLQSVYPAIALKVDGDPTWVVLDADLRVIGTRQEDPNVPTVIVPGPLTLTVGKRTQDEVIVQSLLLARRLADELFTVKTITLIDADSIELALEGGMKAIFTPKKDELVQLRALQVVLSDATILKGVSTIDVRFAQPVLRP